MGKTIIKNIAIVFFLVLCGCQGTKTPKEFLYEVNVERTTYLSDTLYIRKILNQMLFKNIRPYHIKDLYDKNSILDIDTVFYSPDLKKMVVFVITKNAYMKYDNYNPDSIKYMYEGFHFYGYRSKNEKIILNMSCDFNIKSESKEDLKDAFYSYAFIRKSTGHPFDGEPQYNLNDIRLWSSKQMKFQMKDSTNLVLLEKDTLRFLTDIR